MSGKSGSLIGNDPLAWLQDEVTTEDKQIQQEASHQTTVNCPHVEEVGQLMFGDELTISDVHGLREQLVSLLEQEGDVTLNASKVERVDTAGLQLIVAFIQALRMGERTLRWDGVSEEFCNCVEIAGLGEWIECAESGATG